MRKSELQEILNKIPDDYDIYFEANIKDKELGIFKYDQYDINENAKRLYLMLYK